MMVLSLVSVGNEVSGEGKATSMPQTRKANAVGSLRLAALAYAVISTGAVWVVGEIWPNAQIPVAVGAVIATTLLTAQLIVGVLMQLKTSLTGVRAHVSDLRLERKEASTAAGLSELSGRLDEMERRLLDLQRWQRKHYDGTASVARALTGQSIRMDLIRAEWADMRSGAPINDSESR